MVGISKPLIVTRKVRRTGVRSVYHINRLKLVNRVVRVHGSITSVRICRRASNVNPKRPMVAAKRTLSIRLKPNVLSRVFSKVRHPLSAFQRVARDGCLIHKASVPSLGERGI